MTKTVSVIIPAYNSGEYLSETLESVIAQTMTDWECIVVDDGSTDNTKMLVESYCAKEPRIIYLHQVNSGVSDARNNGIRQSSGKYICPLDGDDLLEKTYLEKAVRYLETHADTKHVYCYARTFGAENEVLEFPDFDYQEFLWNNQIFNYAVYRRADYDKTTGYNANMKYGLEDWDFFLSLLKPDDKVFCIKEPLYLYRKRETTRSVTLEDHRKETLVQLYLNHPDIYGEFAKEIVYYRNQEAGLRRKVSELEAELDRLKNTKAYRIGKAVLNPLKWFRKS